jgi:hypothetical protein
MTLNRRDLLKAIAASLAAGSIKNADPEIRDVPDIPSFIRSEAKRWEEGLRAVEVYFRDGELACVVAKDEHGHFVGSPDRAGTLASRGIAVRDDGARMPITLNWNIPALVLGCDVIISSFTPSDADPRRTAGRTSED